MSTPTPSTPANTKPASKAVGLDDRLSTTLSAYQIDASISAYRPDAQNDPYTWAVGGKHRSRGVELSAIGQIIPKKLYLRGSLGVMQAKVVEDKENPNRVASIWTTPVTLPGNLFFRYTPTENLYGEIGVTGTGKRYGYDSRNKEVTTLPGFARVDAMLGWNRKNLNLTFAVGNLFNQKYWRSDAMPGAPRTYTAG